MDYAVQQNCMGSGSHYYGVLSFGAALTHTLDFYSSPQAIEAYGYIQATIRAV